MSLVHSLIEQVRRQPAAEPVRDPAEVERLYRKWRIRILYATTGGYAIFYFVRDNLPMAAPAIIHQYHFTNTEWGGLLSASLIIYAICKFSNGVLADVANPRFLLPVGLFLSALANIAFGLSGGLLAFTLFWMLNNVFSAVGVPPCARLLTHWFSRREIGRAWGIWNASHQIGGAIIAVGAGYLVKHFGWRSAFFAPAGVAMVVTFWLHNRLADSPESLGLPTIEEHQARRDSAMTAPAAVALSGVPSPEASAKAEPPSAAPRANEPYWSMFKRNILTNKGVWLVSSANFFVYVVRIGILQWSPVYLTAAKHLTLINAGVCVFWFEIAGIFGAYSSGWLSDKVFKGRCGCVSTAYMLILVGLVLYLFKINNGDMLVALFAGIGFFVYGPQMLVAVAATDFSTKVASASAVGLTGLLGYFGATFCGLATGFLADHLGWNAAIWMYAGAAATGCVLLAISSVIPNGESRVSDRSGSCNS